MLLLLDHRDSFTFNLVQALSVLGADVVVRAAHETALEEVAALAPEAVLLGPGPGRPEAAELAVALVRKLDPALPILGVCLGHQVIGHAFGARVERARQLEHGRTTVVDHDGRGLFQGLPKPARFTRYNSLVLAEDGLPAELVVTARAEDGDVMAIAHRERPVVGVQFHPEAILSQAGPRLLANFLDLARQAPARGARSS